MKFDLKIKIIITLMVAFCLIGVANLKTVKADEVITMVDEIEFYDESILSENDLEILFYELSQRELKDGDSFAVEDYTVAVNTNLTIAPFSSYTQKSYTHFVNIYHTILGIKVHVATISHSIIYYIYTDGKVHIYQSSSSHRSEHFNYSTSLYDQKITNSTGIYSTADCYFEVVNKLTGTSNLYNISIDLCEGDTSPTVYTGQVW